LDILYIDVVLGLRFWVLQEGVFGFKKKLFWGKGKGVRGEGEAAYRTRRAKPFEKRQMRAF
jgi:hypothetical protein